MSEAFEKGLQVFREVYGDAAADGLLHQVCVDPGPFHHGALNGAQKFGGVQAGKPPAAFADRASGGFDDHRITHVGQARTRYIPLTSKDAAMPFVCGGAVFYWH